jgi:hypothetical protein
MHFKIKKGKYSMRSKGRLYALELSEDAFIIDYENGPELNYDGETPAGDWSIEVDGDLFTITTDGPIIIDKWQLVAVD